MDPKASRVGSSVVEAEFPALDPSTIGLAFTDRDQRYVWVNECLALLNGVSVEEHIGRKVHEIIPDLAQGYERLFSDLIASGAPSVTTVVYGRTPADPGSEHRFLATYYAVRTRDGELIGINAVIQDVTEHERAKQKFLEQEKALRESEALHRALAEVSAVGLYRSTETSSLFSNRGACELAGRSAEELAEMGWLQAIHPDDREEVMALRARAYRDHAPFQIDVRLRRPDGSIVWVLLHSVPEWDAQGQFVGMVGTLTDITHRKLAEQELARHHEHLEELVEQRTRELEASHRELLLSERLAAVGTFAAGIAHQVNNPLGGILLAAEHALESKSDPDAVRIALEDIVSETEHCGRIVRSLLRFSGREEPKRLPVDPNEVVRDAVRAMASTAQQAGCELELQLADGLAPISVDRIAIEELLHNLMQNAVDAGAKHVLLRSEPCENGETILFHVRDDGAGIAPEHITRVFDPFFSTRQAKGGTGLGLSIAQRLAVDHGGSLDLDSELGRGSTVTVALPRDGNESGNRPHR